MSAEQSRLRSAIQRIAKEDPELRGAIKAAKSRGDQPGGTGVGESDAERDQICCDGSTSDSTNPGTDERDPDSGGQDGGLNSTDPALLDMGEGTLSGVTDCATGEPICFSGSGHLPPDGWDDPNDPPPDSTYSSDRFWWVISTFSGAGNCSYISWTEAGAIALYNELSGYTYPDGSLYKRTTSNPTCASGIAGGCSEKGVVCSNPPPDELLYAGEWPADGCTNLAIVNGTIVGSKYDPENDGSYSAPRDEIELCDGDNSILIRPSADGGWKSIQSLAGEPDGAVDNGYLYAPDGKRIRQISPSEFRDDMV